MTVSHFFYQLLIQPLELLLETIYGSAMLFFQKPGLAIFLMSMVMNILLLPLYKQADAIQAAERNMEKELEPVVSHIKKTFKGDERFMMLQTYYRQNNYKPYYTLKGSLPLALEVPFFIAAYHFLSNLSELNGGVLGPIHNLGIPDGLLAIGSVTVNVLPVLMTLINVISSTIYTKGFAFKDKITLYGMALIFLVLLYNSPSGLVFYWTLNNLFSLIKNIFYKIKNPKKVLFSIILAIGAVLLLYSVFLYHPENLRHRTRLLVISLFMFIPFFTLFFRPQRTFIKIKENSDYSRFLYGGIFLSVLTGLVIPSAVVSSSPAEFVQIADYHAPTIHLINSALCATGAFIIWFGIFYYLAGKKTKYIAEIAIWVLSGIAIVDYMFFGTGLGKLTPSLTFENDASVVFGNALSLITSSEKLINLSVILILVLLFGVIFLKRNQVVKIVYCAMISAAVFLTVFNTVKIQKEIPTLKSAAINYHESKTPHFSLSRNGKNVVVIMLDRAISGYIPYIFQEKPELEKQFEGFTYYPNAISFGTSTNIGTPALFGGYEYTPEEINKRSDESMVSKQNEALKVMPVLFEKEDFEVTVCDPVYANYRIIPDLSIFDDHPEINVFNTEQGQFSILPIEQTVKKQSDLWNRNFFCYSLMKISPLAIQFNLYQWGSYFHRENTTNTITDMSHSTGLKMPFVNSFSVLYSLPGMTRIKEDGNTFLTLTNQTPHEPCLLNEPDYFPAEIIDNTEYDASHQSRFVVDGKEMKVTTKEQMAHYHVNMAAMIQIGNWLDYLREQGVYDSTRIIIVADHGNASYQFEDIIFSPDFDAVMAFNPLMMVKDFNCNEFSTDHALMTNADVPTIATSDLITNPINPFTGNMINSEAKNSKELHLFRGNWDTKKNNANSFAPGFWYSVHDNIFDLSNWKELGVW